MKRPYTKPRIIPRTERHLWPREARILDATAWWRPEHEVGVYRGMKDLRAVVDAALAAEAELIGPSVGGRIPTADEQDRRTRAKEIEALWARR